MYPNERNRTKQALKEANKQLRQKEARPTHLKAHRVWLTLTLFAGARISFRAVSRVLHVLAEWLGIGKTPCPQTVINWVMRLAVVRLQSVKLLQGAARHLIPFTNGLIWMIDTSITLGTGKLLSVLALDAQHYQLAGGAPGFQHIRCIAVAVSPSWSGERLADLLERVILVGGRPAAYLKDGGSELKKAVDVLRERGLGSPVIDDISHAVASMLKRRYETHPQFSTFLSACGRVSADSAHGASLPESAQGPNQITLYECAPLGALGRSGAGPLASGKSSFLRAGLLPRLKRDDRHFLPLEFMPSRAPTPHWRTRPGGGHSPGEVRLGSERPDSGRH